MLFISLFLFGCSDVEGSNTEDTGEVTAQTAEEIAEKEDQKEAEQDKKENEEKEKKQAKEKAEEEKRKKKKEKLALEQAEKKKEEERIAKEKAEETKARFEGYRLIKVDGGNLSGHREANVVVDIGFGDREYWGFTNEHGQLVKVIADQIVIQNDSSEPVNSKGRYYPDEAKVPGTESSSLDEGHVIADSLGGVANAYNITPQESTLNRHGDQAYMERNIAQAGGATNFEAIISYPDTKTQIPNKYKYTYTIRGNKVVDEFNNINPDEYNQEQGLTSQPKTEPKKETKKQEVKPKPEPKVETSSDGDLKSVDTNGNGKVTIKEAKEAGFSMPIYKDHWLYQYMIDRDGDGMVGESS